MAASAEVDSNVRIGIARKQEHEILCLARGAFDGGDEKPQFWAYAAQCDSDRHQALVRMTEVMCQRIRLKGHLGEETKIRRAVRDDLAKCAREMPPGMQRVDAMHPALYPHYERHTFRIG